MNSRKKEVSSAVLTYDDVVKLAFENPQTGADAIYSIGYRDAYDNKSGILAPGGHIRIKNGTRFDVPHRLISRSPDLQRHPTMKGLSSKSAQRT